MKLLNLLDAINFSYAPKYKLSIREFNNIIKICALQKYDMDTLYKSEKKTFGR